MAVTTTTNLSLQKPVDEHAIESDVNNLQGAYSSTMDILEGAIGGYATTGTNPSVVNVGGKRFVRIYARVSRGSIATITGMLQNVPFTLIMMSSGASWALKNTSPKRLSADWIPSKHKSSITLIWDGTNYIEVSRVTTS